MEILSQLTIIHNAYFTSLVIIGGLQFVLIISIAYCVQWSGTSTVLMLFSFLFSCFEDHSQFFTQFFRSKYANSPLLSVRARAILPQGSTYRV
jgi:hypothetical protein